MLRTNYEPPNRAHYALSGSTSAHFERFLHVDSTLSWVTHGSHNRENQDQQPVGAGDENRIKNRVRYSFNLNTKFQKQPNTSYTECEDEGQHKREGRELGREGARYWFFINILWLETSPQKCGFLATFFNFEINGLADRFVMEIEENVNPGTGKRQFSKMPFENRKNMQS